MTNSLDEKQKAAGKSAVWYTFATFLTKGLGFITIPIFTRIMTTGEFGLFNNFAAWQIILLAVFSLESYATLNRARLDMHGKELQEYQFTILTCGTGLAFLLGVFLVVLPTVPEMVTDLDRQYLYVMVLYLMFYPAFSMFQTLQRVQYRYKLSAGLSLVSSLAATILSVILVISLPDALMGRVVGQYMPFVLLGFAFYLWYWKSGGRPRWKYLKYALPLCVPLVIATLGSQVLLLGCRIVTQHMCGADEVAFLSLATTLANIALILITALNNAWSPWMYDCLESKDYGRATKTFKLYLWGITLLVILVSVLAPELVFILGGTGYEHTIWLVPGFMVTCLFSMVANQYVFLETYHKDVRAGGVVTLVFGALNLFICAAVIAIFGFEAVGYANVVSNILLIACHKIIIRRFESPDIFSFSTIAFPCAISLISMPVCIMLYALDVMPLRLGLVAAAAAACIVVLFCNRGIIKRKLGKH